MISSPILNTNQHILNWCCKEEIHVDKLRGSQRDQNLVLDLLAEKGSVSRLT